MKGPDSDEVYDLYVFYETKLVSPDDPEPRIIYAVVEFEGVFEEKTNTCTYTILKNYPGWTYSAYDWFETWHVGDIHSYETTLTDEELRAMFGWDMYLEDAAEISAEDASTLIEQGYAMLSETYNDLIFDSACLYVAANVFSSPRNQLYLYFTRTQEYEDGTSITYYFPLHASNIQVLTDETGNRRLDLDSVVLTEEDYLTELPANRGWVPLKWIENNS